MSSLDDLLGGTLEDRIQAELCRIEGRTLLTGDPHDTSPIVLPEAVSEPLPDDPVEDAQIHALILEPAETAHTAPIDISSVVGIAALEPTTASVLIINPLISGPDYSPMTQEVAIIEAKAFPATRFELWLRFYFGLALFFGACVAGVYAALPQADTFVWVAVSVVSGIVSAWVLGLTIHQNDQRLAALKTAGLQ